MKRTFAIAAIVTLSLALPSAGDATIASFSAMVAGRPTARIAFAGEKSWPGSPFDTDQIYIERTDGTGLTRLTSGKHQFGPTAWSPDGRQIAFGVDGRLVVMDADGSNERTIVTDGFNGQPDWSPDGTTIAFSRQPPCDDGQARCPDGIFTVGVNGEDLTQITRGPFDYEPSWSPDGRRLAFSFAGHSAAYVEIVNLDGTDEHRVTAGRNGYEATWSPAHNVILFVSPSKVVKELRPTTGHVHVVFRCRDPCKSVANPSWSPNGRKIVLSEEEKRGRRLRPPHLAIMNADGGHLRRLRTHGLVPVFPEWA